MPAPTRVQDGGARPSAPLLCEGSFTARDLAVAAGITPARLAGLIELGLVEPIRPGGSEFSAAAAARLRRMLRLRADLGVSFVGAAIIVDLVDRIERVESELARALRRARSGL